MSVTILEHHSDKYPPRTFHNAAKSDLTIAFAINFNTAGERLTHKAACGKYLAVSVANPNFNEIGKYIEINQPKIINIAGNSERTFTDNSIPMTTVRNVIKSVMVYIQSICSITKILSGGQTGADIIGASVGHELEIDVEIMMPKGYIQRNMEGRDIKHNYDDILQQIC
jgi:hypothetical protein